MLKTISKWVITGAVAMSLFSGAVTKEAHAATPLYPSEVKVNYQKGYSSADGGDRQQPYVDLGNKTGTLVFKMYPIYKGIWSTNIWLAAKNNLTGNYFLTDKPSAFEENINGLYAFDLYSSWNKTGKKNISSYEAGFTNAGTAPNGRDYIGLAVYLPKAQNGGRYYLQHSSMSEGTWEIKAYFYENVDLEDALFFQVDKLFPFVGKIMWGKTEVKPGQTGKLTIKEPITLWKETDGKLVALKTLNKGEEYRIYGYRADHGGQYNMGAGTYVNLDPAKAYYETPSKAKLQLAKMLYQD